MLCLHFQITKRHKPTPSQDPKPASADPVLLSNKQGKSKKNKKQKTKETKGMFTNGGI